ncbi:MAG: hypothetical protein ACOX3K_04550 [Bacilli bacterium]|jgi:hypothetical protein
MRDKLTKFNRNARYYRMRKGLLSLAGVFLLGLGVAVPLAAKAQADAADKISETTSIIESSSSETTSDGEVAPDFNLD